MRVQHRMFKSSFKFWDEICNEAAEFASQIHPDRLISISQSCDHSTGVVVVWYHVGDNRELPYVQKPVE
jgi:hypothetical protein